MTYLLDKTWVDHLRKEIERQEKTYIQNTYPPYNIIEHKEDSIEIQVAVAGFDRSELEVRTEGDYLYIEGTKKPEESSDVKYHFKGIATRKFKLYWRIFYREENYQVKDVSLTNTGLLSVLLERVVPEDKKRKVIEIK